MILNKRELAECLEVSEQSLSDWAKEGLPIFEPGEKGLPHKYKVGDVHRWLCDRALRKAGIERPQDRLFRAQAIKTERENAVAERRLIPMDEIEPEWADLVLGCRREMLLVPDDPALCASCREIVRSGVDAALLKLAKDEQDDSDESRDQVVPA